MCGGGVELHVRGYDPDPGTAGYLSKNIVPAHSISWRGSGD